MNNKAHKHETIPVPVKEQKVVIGSLLYHLNEPKSEVKQRTIVARHRHTEFKVGAIESIPGQAVFDNVWKRFEK